jgi:pseudo-rSAM protein
LNKKQKKYWFILDNYIHVSVKDNSVMFYNPLTGKILEYNGSEAVLKMVKRLHSPKNLLVTRITGEEFLNPEISQLVSDLRGYFMGDLLETSLTKIKPVQMMPYAKVYKDAEIIRKTPTRSVGEHMMKYLVEISLYINSDCSLDCAICGSAYKQFLCCTRTKNQEEELNIQSIKNLIWQSQGAPLVRVNILGGDIFKFSKLEELLVILKGFSFKKVFYTHYLNLIRHEDKLGLFPADSSSFSILVTFPVEEDQWKVSVELLRAHDIKADFLFIVSSETDVTRAEELISSFGLDNYSLHPFFNGNNLDFFERNIFLDKEDLQKAKPTDKDIHARQLVNPFHFGRLTVLSNGHIHANVNTSRLGTLDKDSIHQAVYKEMYRGKNWRRIRKRTAPCKSCTFSELCPPLSNYEYAIGKNNLCHIWKESATPPYSRSA